MLREGEVLGVFTPNDAVCYGYPCGGCPNCLKLQTLNAIEHNFNSEQEADELVRVYTRDARMREKLNRGWRQSRARLHANNDKAVQNTEIFDVEKEDEPSF